MEEERYPTGASAAAPAAAPPQPAAAPIRHHPHHSFIWLGGLRTLFVVLWCAVIGAFSGIAALAAELAEYGSGHASGAGMLVAVIIGALLLFILVVAVLCFIIRWVQWRHFWYEFDPAEFSIYSGVISKKKTHVPYTRVQSVDQKASLLQRILGLCVVSIDTAGGASNKAITIPYVTKSQAEELRNQLYMRKAQLTGAAGTANASASVPGAMPAAPGAIPFAAAPASAGNILDGASDFANSATGLFDAPGSFQQAPSFEYGLSNKELLFTGLFNNTSFMVVVVGLVAFFGQILQGLVDVVPNSDAMLESTVENMVAREGALMAGGIAIGGFVAICLVIWALSAVGTMLKFGGFKARRRGDRIEVERGILQHQFQGVAMDRVQSVIISQSFVRRIMGYCEISLGKIDAASGSNGEAESGSKDGATGKVVVHPFVKKSECARIISGLLPEFSDMPTEVTPVAKVALRRAVIRRTLWQGSGFWIIVFAALCQGGMHLGAVLSNDPELWDMLFIFDYGAAFLYAAGVVCMIVNCIGAVLWARESSFAVNRRFMQVSNGGIGRESITFPRQKIQFGNTRSNPFQRRAKTVTLQATIAAGIGGTTIGLIDVTEGAGAAWLQWLEPRR